MCGYRLESEVSLLHGPDYWPAMEVARLSQWRVTVGINIQELPSIESVPYLLIQRNCIPQNQLGSIITHEC